MGVNRSRNCHEGSFREHISRTWACKKMYQGNSWCHRKHWADYLNATFCEDPTHKRNPSCRKGITAAKGHWHLPRGAHLRHAEPDGTAAAAPRRGRGILGALRARGGGRRRRGRHGQRDAIVRAKLQDWAELAIGVQAPAERAAQEPGKEKLPTWKAGLVDF